MTREESRVGRRARFIRRGRVGTEWGQELRERKPRARPDVVETEPGRGQLPLASAGPVEGTVAVGKCLLRCTGWGKRMFTVVRMENNATINK